MAKNFRFGGKEKRGEKKVKKDNKVTILNFRCTQEEKEKIIQGAKRYQVGISEYIRMEMLKKENRFFDPEVSQKLKDMNWEINKIGTNINQIARICNSKKFVSRKEIEGILKNLNLISYILQNGFEELRNSQAGKSQNEKS
jgi:Bacterial mobilisation protein (MobC).